MDREFISAISSNLVQLMRYFCMSVFKDAKKDVHLLILILLHRSPPKRRMGETTVIRRQSNVHRLSDRTDSDEDNNTWNGNSTQQM